MSLLNTETTTSATTFEQDDDVALVQATASGATSAAAAAPAAAQTPAVQTTGSAVSTSLRQAKNAFEAFRDALPVDYNTLDQLIATNGNFMDRESKTVLGDVVTFDLLSFQDSWVVSPEVDTAPKEAVRFSGDGVTCSDGTPVKEHLEFLKQNGYPDARVKQRVVVVGAVQSATKSDKFNQQLVQFDLSPASRTLWQRFAANATYALTTGRATPEQVSKVRAEAVLKTRGNDTYTVASFTVAA